MDNGKKSNKSKCLLVAAVYVACLANILSAKSIFQAGEERWSSNSKSKPCSSSCYLNNSFVSGPCACTVSGKLTGYTEKVVIQKYEKSSYTGRLQWKVHSPQVNVHTFLGVPFAQAPIGKRRFLRPQPFYDPMTARRTTSFKPACWQTFDTMFTKTPASKMWVPNSGRSEDCLYLNIWAPNPSKNPNRKRAVMVWIYGGGFTTGTSTLKVYNGKYLAAYEGVIVVSMNYRVGPHGFLYLGKDSQVNGNMGLWDQREALKWIRNNIEAFGGNPKRVTIFGESAGAVSVALQTITPWSQNLFANAVMQSGSIYCNWGTMNRWEAKEAGDEYTEALRCNHKNPEKALECLQSRTNEDLEKTFINMYKYKKYFEVPIAPVLDGIFLPYSHTEERKFKNLDYLKPSVNLLMGVNKNEGAYFLLYAFITNSSFNDGLHTIRMRNEKEFDSKLSSVIPGNYSFANMIFESAKFEYLFEKGEMLKENNNDKYTRVLEKISSDFSFKCPTIEMARTASIISSKGLNMKDADSNDPKTSHMAKRRVYFYEFQHRTASLPWPKWMGVIHGYEIEYVFGMPFSRRFQQNFYEFNDEERSLSRRMMHYWANFARMSDPNIEPTEEDIPEAYAPLEEYSLWHDFSHRNQWSTKKFDQGGGLSFGAAPSKRTCKFWNRVFPLWKKQFKNRRTCNRL